MTDRPIVVLTRPEPDSRRVAEEIGGDFEFVITPVFRVEPTGAQVDLSPFQGVILTSVNAVRFAPDLTGVPAYCVGARTAKLCGGDVRLVARDADDFVARIQADGPLLHLRGEETRGDIEERLNLAGLETKSAVLYRQKTVDLLPEAKHLLEGPRPVVLPLWSPRSAERVADQIARIGANVHVIAFSRAVADAWRAKTGGGAEICNTPSQDEMTRRIVAALRP